MSPAPQAGPPAPDLPTPAAAAPAPPERARPDPGGGLPSRIFSATSISYVGFAVYFLSSVLLARVLGPAGKGVFSVLMAAVAALLKFSTLGIPNGQTYHVLKRPELARHFMATGYTLAPILGIAVGALYFGGGGWLGLDAVEVADGVATAAAVLLLPVGIALTFQRQFFLAHHRYVLSKTSLALAHALPLLGYVALALLGVADPSYFFLAYVLVQLAVLVGFLPLERRTLPDRGAFSSGLARLGLKYGFRQALSESSLYLFMRLDYLLVLQFLGQSRLGVYSVAMALAEITPRLTNEVGTMLFPIFASGRLPLDRRLAALRTMILLALGLSLALVMVADPVLPLLFGEEFADAVPALRILALGGVAWSVIHVAWPHTAAENRPGLGAPIFAAAAMLDFGLNLLLLPRLGVTGAAIAATTSYTFAAAVFLWIFLRDTRSTLRDAVVVRPSDVRNLIQMTKSIAEKGVRWRR